MEGLQKLSDKEIRVPDRHRLEADHSSEFNILLLHSISLVTPQ
jgi:hypothetical protein